MCLSLFRLHCSLRSQFGRKGLDRSQLGRNLVCIGLVLDNLFLGVVLFRALEQESEVLVPELVKVAFVRIDLKLGLLPAAGLLVLVLALMLVPVSGIGFALLL